MKTKERIDQAYKRIKELFLLINDWTRGVKETNSEYVEIKKRKQEIIDDLYIELGQLNQIWTEKELELSDKDYVVKFDNIKQRIKELEKELLISNKKIELLNKEYVGEYTDYVIDHYIHHYFPEYQ